MKNFFSLPRKGESGFTLIEMIVAMAIGAIILMLAASALRHYWFVRSLTGGADQVVTQLRQLQTKTQAETHPLVYGAMFAPGSDEWILVRYDPGDPIETCQRYGQRKIFDGGVVVDAATSFEKDGSGIVDYCSTKSFATAVSNPKFVMFFARGDATKGQLVLRSNTLGRTKIVTVGGVTGRVEAE